MSPNSRRRTSTSCRAKRGRKRPPCTCSARGARSARGAGGRRGPFSCACRRSRAGARRRASRRPSSSSGAPTAPRRARRGRRRSPRARWRRELSARHHAALPRRPRRQPPARAAASAQAYGVGACGGPAPVLVAGPPAAVHDGGGDGGARRDVEAWRAPPDSCAAPTAAACAPTSSTARARRARSSPRAALRPSWRVPRAAARRRAGASAASARAAPPPGFDDAPPGSAVFADAELDGDATAGARVASGPAQRQQRRGADWSWSPCGTRHPPTPMQQSRSVPTLNFQRTWRRRRRGDQLAAHARAHAAHAADGTLDVHIERARRRGHAARRARRGACAVRSASLAEPGARRARTLAVGRSLAGVDVGRVRRLVPLLSR